MKRLIFLLQLTLYYIAGNLIFNIFFSITQLLILKSISTSRLNMDFYSIFLESVEKSIGIYTILYCVILLIYVFHTILSLRKLNKNLEKLKERRKENEK